ncbi:MAG: hypothetical protein DMF59_08365 [Acidobacteria bacterium]|nr:MAG: hypothetical protein DMF59_08365 [Acidobacteriota bacterium]
MRRTIQVLILATAGVALFGATTVQVSKVPEGVEITNKKVKVKPGYAFQRASANKAYSVVTAGRNKGSATGTFTCSCKATTGECHVDIVTDGSLECNGCSDCRLTITPGKDGKIEVQPVH